MSRAEKIALSFGLKARRVEVVESPPDNSLNANTDGSRIQITRNMLALQDVARDYVIAHELAHVVRWHGGRNLIALSMFLGGLLVALESLASNIWLSSFMALVAVIGLVYLFVDQLTMVIEWEADRCAAKVLGEQAMLQGMADLKAANVPELHWHYESKMNRLSNAPARIWRSPPKA